MKIILEKVTSIPSGVVLGLSQEQADARLHAIKPHGKKKGEWLVTSPVQFKAGESIDVLSQLPKGVLPCFDAAVAADEKDIGAGDEATGD